MLGLVVWTRYLVFALIQDVASGFVVQSPTSRNLREKKARSTSFPTARDDSLTSLKVVKIDGYDDAFGIIDQCAVRGTSSEELFNAVRFVEKNALQLYPTLEEKQALWDSAHGSWKLQLATGGGKYTTFKPVPIFAFAMVDEMNFGNGIGWNANSIVLSLLGPHIFNTQRRQMVITIDDMFLGANKVSKFVPGFLKDAMELGKQPEDFEKRPPAFTFIGASDKSLIARGGTGGIAIWTRLDQDICLAAYGTSESQI
jgi:hypothetical protein